MRADEGDRFLKCAKAFGEDARRAREWAEGAGVACGYDPDVPSLALADDDAAALEEACPSIVLAESVNVAEEREPDGAPRSGRAGARPELYLREVAVEPRA